MNIVPIQYLDCFIWVSQKNIRLRLSKMFISKINLFWVFFILKKLHLCVIKKTRRKKLRLWINNIWVLSLIWIIQIYFIFCFSLLYVHLLFFIEKISYWWIIFIFHKILKALLIYIKCFLIYSVSMENINLLFWWVVKLN